MLEARSLNVSVPSRSLVRGLDLAVAPGESWALLAPNGGGKTLLLHTLAALRAPSGGTVALEGRPLASWPRRMLARRIALLLQEEAADYWGSVAEYVALGRLPHGRADASDPSVHQALHSVGLNERAAQSFRSLSGGERQRARLAQSIAQDTPVMLWDEPLNHLDLRHQRDVMHLARALAAAGKAVVLSLHEPVWAASCCTHALLLYDSGRTAAGPARSVITDRAMSELYCLEQPTPAFTAADQQASVISTGMPASR
jgi:iron complex transport system ATP-binding protein